MGSPEGCAFVLTWPFAGAEHSKRCQDERAQKGPTRPLTMNLIQTSPPTSPKLGSWLSGPSNSAQGPPGLPRCCSKPGEPWNRGDILAMQSGFLTSFIYGYHVITESAQPISARKAQSRKIKDHIPLRTSWISPRMCLSCLIIIQSCYFDYRICKPYACSRCVICVSFLL